MAPKSDPCWQACIRMFLTRMFHRSSESCVRPCECMQWTVHGPKLFTVQTRRTVTPNKPASAIWRRDDVTMVLDSWSQSQDGAEKVAFVIRTRKRLDEARAVSGQSVPSGMH